MTMTVLLCNPQLFAVSLTYCHQAYEFCESVVSGLLESTSGDNKFLREEIVYPHRVSLVLAREKGRIIGFFVFVVFHSKF